MCIPFAYTDADKCYKKSNREVLFLFCAWPLPQRPTRVRAQVSEIAKIGAAATPERVIGSAATLPPSLPAESAHAH